jgi:two-component system phosphate regulon response regulator OmpR
VVCSTFRVLRKLKYRVLAVDDDSSVCDLLRRVFVETGRYIVATETESHRTIKTARLFRPDLLILDLNMPGQSGQDLTRWLRTEPWLRYRPIIFFTGRPEPDDLSSWVTDAATVYLHKESPIDVVVQTADRLLGVPALSAGDPQKV